MDALITDILTTGSETIYPEGISELLGVPAGSKAKRKSGQRNEAVDGLLRRFDVLVDPSTTSMRASGLVLRSIWQDIAKGESKILYIRLSILGVPEKAIETHVKIDQQGRTIPGSGVGKTVNLDIHAGGTRLLLKRELDFWLKGLGRKPKAEGAESARQK